MTNLIHCKYYKYSDRGNIIEIILSLFCVFVDFNNKTLAQTRAYMSHINAHIGI